MATSISVLVAVTHRSVRQGVRLLIGSQPGYTVVGEAEERARALALAAQHHPDVLVLDLILTSLDYLDFLRGLSAASPKTRVIVLLTPADGLSAADGTAGRELIEAVRDAATRPRRVSIPLPVAIVDTRAPGSPSTRSDPFETLTPREREVLLLAVEGCSSTETARRLGISARTAESHRAHVMRKLGLHRRADLVRYAMERGIMSAGDDGARD